MKVVVLGIVMVLLAGVGCEAAVKTVGKQDTLALDPSTLPPAMKANYEIVKAKCVKCHTLERIVMAVTTGVAPITGQPFTHDATKTFGCKLGRNANANLTKKEIKAAVDLMNYLLDQGER